MIVDGGGGRGEGGVPILVYRRWCRLEAVDAVFLKNAMILLLLMIVYALHPPRLLD